MEIIIDTQDKDIGKRLDLFLSLHVPDISRSAIKKTIESNKVTVNSEICYKAGYKVRGGDVLTYPDEELQTLPYTKLIPSEFDLEILYEDTDYIFINKPSGLKVHPTHLNETDTLVNKLLGLKAELPGNHFLRPGIVHRLDKDTSGVIVVAQNPKSLWWISQQFADRKVKKNYLSLSLNTDSNFKHKPGEHLAYESNIVRSSSDRRQYRVEKLHNNVTVKGRYAKTEFEFIDIVKIGGVHIIKTKVYPLTGRTHQIRVHERALNFPIIGDPIYLSKKEFELSSEIIQDLHSVNRLMLHAEKIAFENYDGKMYSISAQEPIEMKTLINNAKKSSV